MIKCVVQFFGLPSETTELREVEVELKDGARLGDVIAALRREIPTLEEHVIRAGEDRLTEYYAFNINGQFYPDGRDFHIQDGDHLLLLALATGG